MYGNSLQGAEPKPQIEENTFQEKDALLQGTMCALNQRALYAAFSPSRKNTCVQGAQMFLLTITSSDHMGVCASYPHNSGLSRVRGPVPNGGTQARGYGRSVIEL